MTSTAPLPAGLMAVQSVALLQLTAADAVPPNRTVVAPDAGSKLLPVTVTTVPPVTGPRTGLIPVTAGVAAVA